MSTGAHVACDTPISELKSATPAMVLSLNKKGITTIGDLLRASFDEVAYQLDSFDDAEALIAQAREHVEALGSSAEPSGPSGRGASMDEPREQPPAESSGAGSEPRRHDEASDQARGRAGSGGSTEGGHVGLASAMQAVLSLDGGAFASLEASAAAAQRLAAASLIIQHGGGEEEAVAAGLLDTIDPKAPSVDRRDAAVRFGEPAVDLLERAELLLTVPMSPSGKPSNVHAKLVEVADGSALLVAACGAVASARAVLARYHGAGDRAWSLFTGGREFALWYFNSVARALGPALKRAGREGLAHELWTVVRALEACGGSQDKAA
ncbi:MAG: hypothetical protein KatS3mg103_0161 [Phycisphaerales bacterium]|nr:MAG: hypothetical protein KatS3mg103_0161 [Phycisphaerales bacterium]